MEVKHYVLDDRFSVKWYLSVLLGCLLCTATVQAKPDDELLRLEADMLKYIGTNERDSFFIITERMKDACMEKGEERMFYKAWSNQAVYEATHLNFGKATEIAQALADYATKENSVIGQYYAKHTQAFVLQQKDDGDAAEQAYLEAMNILHKHFPNESAAEDLRELMKIAYMRGDAAQAKAYANQLLAEPHLAPHHKGRTLYRLSIMVFDENNVQEFNRIYEEMKRLMQTDGIKSLDILTEVNYNIINGDYKQALRLADWMAPDTCAERKALIYHRMGDNEKAYEYMAQYKRISDSLAHASHNNIVSNIYLQMNNDRLHLEQESLSYQNSQWRFRFYFAIGICLILILALFIYQRHRLIKLLKNNNLMLDYGKMDAEKARKDLDKLTANGTVTELPLTTPVKLNDFCKRLTELTQKHCQRDVEALFLTDLSDDFEVKTHADALEKLLMHLLNYSARFTHSGSIKLKCEASGPYVRMTITDTGLPLGHKRKNRFVRMFVEKGNTVRYVGLNFNIWKSIARLIQGRLWHDTEYSDGTRFCIEIPNIC